MRQVYGAYKPFSSFRTGFPHFSVVFNSILQSTGMSCGRHISGRIVGPLVLDKSVKFDDPGLNHSREISPEAVGGGIFDCFPPITSDLKQIMM